MQDESDASAHHAARGRRSRRASSAHERPEELVGRDDAFVMYFKERVYATFTGLAIVLVVGADDNPEPDHAFFALLLGVLGITVAGSVSDVIAHLAVHQTFPDRAERTILLRVAGGSFGTVVTPGILLALAWFEVMPLDAALSAAAIVYMVTLGVIGWFAVRRSRLQWWKQLLVLAMLLALGLAVVVLQTLAHSV